MKSISAVKTDYSFESRPARGAWIEILSLLFDGVEPHRRAPHGARGLKFKLAVADDDGIVSRPARGAWIEI